MDVARKSSSLTWYDYMFFKVVSETSETRYSLDQYGIDYFLQLHEAIALKEYIRDLEYRDIEVKRLSEKNKPKI
ncbi:TPA: hypothetical protein MCM29_005577 [Klebsiella pneumoniae]|nr:hypothetical protein vBKpMFBKp34_169 [Klebsiella phage vB_KpM_FBKp34]UYL04374.1 hypothetical protein EPNKCIFM_00072 [Klebsiella phage KP13-16]HBT0444898.1 hypothetical protein [Klebsiella pneumoniae]HBT8980829.1 hypothetical protein [Klebsiella pneumoniae]